MGAGAEEITLIYNSRVDKIKYRASLARFLDIFDAFLHLSSLSGLRSESYCLAFFEFLFLPMSNLLRHLC